MCTCRCGSKRCLHNKHGEMKLKNTAKWLSRHVFMRGYPSRSRENPANGAAAVLFRGRIGVNGMYQKRHYCDQVPSWCVRSIRSSFVVKRQADRQTVVKRQADRQTASACLLVLFLNSNVWCSCDSMGKTPCAQCSALGECWLD